MRAALYHGVGDVRLAEIDEPVAGPGQVKMQVSFNGLCGTDLHEVFDSQRAIPSEPHPLTGARAPLVLGHEIGGTVVAVGSGCEDVAVGALVAVEPLHRCGACRSCLAGNFNLCDRLAFHGLSTGGGGLSEFTVVPKEMIHAVPAGVTPQGAAMVEPLSVAWHAVTRAEVQTGQSAAVLGGGPIGIGIYLALRLRGIEALVVEPSADRRAVLATLGATVLDPAEGPVAGQLLDATAGRGVDRCFETSASVVSLESALAATAKHGVVMLLASPRQPLPPVLGLALAKELDIRTTYGYHGDFPVVIDAVAAGLVPFDGWVTTMPMSRLHEALDEMHAGRLLKVLIDPTA
ncbi:MAG TPA: alcohol dehydrogenase catalytic domain-containing protein [Acidimicrobiales bacterium]